MGFSCWCFTADGARILLPPGFPEFGVGGPRGGGEAARAVCPARTSRSRRGHAAAGREWGGELRAPGAASCESGRGACAPRTGSGAGEAGLARGVPGEWSQCGSTLSAAATWFPYYCCSACCGVTLNQRSCLSGVWMGVAVGGCLPACLPPSLPLEFGVGRHL